MDGRAALYDVVTALEDAPSPPDDPRLRALLLAMRVDGQVRNGGIGQCLVNVDATLDEMATALVTVGAVAQAELCKSAATLLEEGDATLRPSVAAWVAGDDDGEYSSFLARFSTLSDAWISCERTVASAAGSLLSALLEEPAVLATVTALGVSAATLAAPKPIGDSLLIDACAEADDAWVTRLIAAGHPVNARAPGKDPPLAVCLRDGWQGQSAARLRCTELLLAAGADPNALDRFGEPLVFLAASNIDWFLALVHAGARVDVRAGEHTLLHVAAHPDVARFLLARGADVHDAAGGTTPLHDVVKIVRMGRVPPGAVEVLLAAGADPNDGGRDGRMSLAAGNDAATLQTLLDAGMRPAAPPDDEGLHPWGLLHEAADLGWADTAAALLDVGVDPLSPLANDEPRYKRTLPRGATALDIAAAPPLPSATDETRAGKRRVLGLLRAALLLRG